MNNILEITILILNILIIGVLLYKLFSMKKKEGFVLASCPPDTYNANNYGRCLPLFNASVEGPYVACKPESQYPLMPSCRC